MSALSCRFFARLAFFCASFASFSVLVRAADGVADIPAEVAEYVAAPEVTLNLWPNVPPGGIPENIGEEKWVPGKETPPIVRIQDVSIPTLAFYRAPKPNGACVVIFPGGGFNILAYNHEGSEIAQWLNGIGVSAVVVKYRVPRRVGLDMTTAPLQDAQRAIRIVRSKAKEWEINPKNVGVLGFSAGGCLTVAAALDYATQSYEPFDEIDALDCKPNFAIPIYPAYMMDDEREMSAAAQLSERVKI
ncbi:MAG: alpha/beta hydrolase, partial [Thermoguttaceae bacterium]|nr:alpha/beta hydrolase [Thermoguttaceae bacterium]